MNLRGVWDSGMVSCLSFVPSFGIWKILKRAEVSKVEVIGRREVSSVGTIGKFEKSFRYELHLVSIFRNRESSWKYTAMELTEVHSRKCQSDLPDKAQQRNSRRNRGSRR